MSAVWRTARAAVRRRKLQTIVIGIVVAVSTTMTVVALGLLAASSAPFDQAFNRQHGAQLVTAFDGTAVSDARILAAARQAGATAVAGPFGQAAVDVAPPQELGSVPLTLVGRDSPGGAVDQLTVWRGRWPTRPGEIVLARSPIDPPTGIGPLPGDVGSTLNVVGGQVLTIVGFASSISQTADGWVTAAQLQALHPTVRQVLYSFARGSTAAQLDADLATATSGLPAGALLGSRSYLTLRAEAASQPSTLVAFLVVFGCLGLAVAVLIVANVVSGAVVAGFRHIGVLKSLGFTPDQVMVIYLAMVLVPAVVGCVLGTVLGNLLADPLLTQAFGYLGSGGPGVAPWVDVVTLLGVPTIVALSALVPSLRARGLSASEAISAGSAPHRGRGLVLQRWLSGTRLPRAASLGLGMPFARPALSAMTMAAVVLGVTSVTLATGLADSVTRYQRAEHRVGAVQLALFAGGGPSDQDPATAPAATTPADPASVPSAAEPKNPGGVQSTASQSGAPVTASPAGGGQTGPPGTAPSGGAAPLNPGQPTGPTLSDSADVAMLQALPGTLRVTPSAELEVNQTGTTERTLAKFYRGDDSGLGYQVVRGSWPTGPGEAAVSTRFLVHRGLKVGDTVTIEAKGARTSVRIVGLLLLNDSNLMISTWDTLTVLAPGTRADMYELQLKPGTDPKAYGEAAQKADPGLQVASDDGIDSFVATIYVTVSLLTLMLALVAALGVFNTVVLNTRERRRDLGMLKSIGMTPGQVTAMVVISMALLGVVGGLVGVPLGIAAHRVVLPAMARAAEVDFTPTMLQVYRWPLLALFLLAGVAIAALGAYLPARTAARATIAEVLRNE